MRCSRELNLLLGTIPLLASNKVINAVLDVDLGDGQFSERCDVDGSFFNSDAILIIFGKA